MLVAILLGAAVAVSGATPRFSVGGSALVRQSLSANQMFALADQAQSRGQADLAEAIYRAMLADGSADVRAEARFRLAKLAEARGRYTEAALLLRRILDEKPREAPVRIALAQLLDRMGDKDAAWREARAAQAIGLPPEIARLVDRYSEALRAVRPWGVTFEIAMAPDSNINRATRSDTLGTVLGDFEIAEDGKPKSGTGLSLRTQAYRRMPLGDVSLLVRASGQADLYKKSEFNDVAIDLGAGPEIELGRGRLNLELGVTQRWFGQKPFQRSARTSVSFSRPVGRRTLVRAGASAALVDNRLNALQDGKAYSAQLGLERALTATMGVAGSLSIDRQSLRDPGYSTTGWRATLTGWRELGRMTLTAGAEIGRLRADERLILFPEKRSDRYSRFTVGATFRRLQFRGFAPVARFSIERNRSTIEFYDYRRSRAEFGIVRAF
jgi:hypothetical protein